MTTQFDAWLRQLALDGRGGDALHLPSISRGRSYALQFNLATHSVLGDWTAGAFAMEARLSPDAAGAAAAIFTCTTGTPAGGITSVTANLSSGAQSGLPSDADADGLAFVYYELTYTYDGVKYAVAGGKIPVAGAV